MARMADFADTWEARYPAIARLGENATARGHFPTEQAALKHLYLTICSLDPAGRRRQRRTSRWKTALNAFAITFDGRILTNKENRDAPSTRQPFAGGRSRLG